MIAPNAPNRRRAVTLLVGALACAASAIGATGCGFTEMHEVVLRRPGPPTSRVELYIGDRVPARPFYEIALLQAVGHGGDANAEETMRAIESRASVLGCDAVVKLRYDQGYSMANAVGVCVKWATEAAPATPVAPVPAPAATPPAQAPAPQTAPAPPTPPEPPTSTPQSI